MKHNTPLERKKVQTLDGPYIEYQNKKLLDFSSLDILGLGTHPDVKKNSIKYTLKLGIKTIPFPLEPFFQTQVEQKLAQIVSVEKCCLFDSQKEAFYELSQSFKEASVFADHTYPFFSQATYFENADSLKKMIKDSKKPTLIFAKSSREDLDKIATLSQESNCFLCLDHSDTFGITGKRGVGSLPKERKNIVIIGSFQLIGGFSTGYIGSSYQFLQRNSLSPAILGAIDAVLNLSPDMDHEREQVFSHFSWLHKELKEKGFLQFSEKFPTTILSFSSEEEAEKLWNAFYVEGIFLGRPSSCQISFTMTALHTPDDLDQLSCVLKKLSATDFALVTQSATPTP